MPQIDDYLGTFTDRTVEPLPKLEIISRIAYMGAELHLHERFTALLGIASVTATRLPLSIELLFEYNDSDLDDMLVYVTEIHNKEQKRMAISMAVNRYIFTRIEKEEL